MKVPFIIYADMGSLLEELSTCHINPNESPATKINKHTPSSYSLFTHYLLNNTKNSLDYYRDQNYKKTFCKDLKDHAKKKNQL